MIRYATRLGLLACLAAAGPSPALVAGDAFSSAVRPILAARCFGCHSGKAPEAGLDLSRFSGEAEVLAGFRVWEEVARKIEAGEMPPEEARPLTIAERRTLADWRRKTFLDLEPRPGPSRPRRLTRTEYRNTLADLLGIPLRRSRGDSFYNVEAGSIVEKLLAADPPGPSGFDNDASVLALGPTEFEKALRIAEYAVEQLDSLPEARRGIFAAGAAEASATPRDRARAIVARFAGRAFRRPVAEADLAPLLKVFETAYDPIGDRAKKSGAASVILEGRFVEAVQDAVTAVLVSPKFLYRLETARGSHEPYRIGDHELAGRLSYFLWSTMPDDELTRLALEGRLHRSDVLDRQVDRMLADPRSIALAENLGGQWLGYAELENPDRYRVGRSEESIKLLRSMY
ncbi:MAG TPA: DUF1592 domain-containing protein, partial [Isosphaeraceae bacterium]